MNGLEVQLAALKVFGHSGSSQMVLERDGKYHLPWELNLNEDMDMVGMVKKKKIVPEKKN